MSYIGNQPSTANFAFDQFSGNASQTAFTLTSAPASTSSIIVAISGVVQNPNAYSISGLTLTFTGAPPTGTNNIVILYLGLPVSIGVPGDGTVTPAKLDRTYATLNTLQSFTAAQRGTPVVLTSSSASIASNFALGNNFTHTTSENTTLANPSNLGAGQSGIIVITQGGTARTMAFGSNWKFPSGTAPSLTGTAGAVDVLAYYVESSTRISARLVSDVR